MEKVLVLVFNNFKNDSRVLKECFSLIENGYDVQVVALHEGDLKEYENVNGIPVHRIKLRTRKFSKKLFSQMFKYMELAWVISKKYRNQVDLIHCNDLLPLPISVSLKRKSKKKVKIIYDAHEFQTETQKLVGRELRKKLMIALEKRYIKHADAVITVSEGIAKEYSKRYNIDVPRLVLNCPPYQRVEKGDIFRKNFQIEPDTKIFLYQGAIAPGRGIESIVEVFKDLKDEKGACVIFMGMGQLVPYVKEHVEKYDNIYFQEAVPPSEILKFTSSADVGISLIEATCLNYYYSLPNKMFEYAMAGLPTITSNLPEMKKVVEKYNGGLIVKDNTMEGIKKAIIEFLQRDSSKYEGNLKKMVEEYNWENQEKVLLDVYQSL